IVGSNPTASARTIVLEKSLTFTRLASYEGWRVFCLSGAGFNNQYKSRCGIRIEGLLLWRAVAEKEIFNAYNEIPSIRDKDQFLIPFIEVINDPEVAALVYVAAHAGRRRSGRPAAAAVDSHGFAQDEFDQAQMC